MSRLASLAAPISPNSHPETVKRHPEPSDARGRAAGVVCHAQMTSSITRLRTHRQVDSHLTVVGGELRNKRASNRPGELRNGPEKHRR